MFWLNRVLKSIICQVLEVELERRSRDQNVSVLWAHSRGVLFRSTPFEARKKGVLYQHWLSALVTSRFWVGRAQFFELRPGLRYARQIVSFIQVAIQGEMKTETLKGAFPPLVRDLYCRISCWRYVISPERERRKSGAKPPAKALVPGYSETPL